MDPERARELLARERTRIERALTDLLPDANEELADIDQHIAERGSQLFDEELDMGLVDDLREELAAVKRAERRLEAGTYGISIESGKPIPDERLEIMPTAERTTEEQERFERGGL